LGLVEGRKGAGGGKQSSRSAGGTRNNVGGADKEGMQVLHETNAVGFHDPKGGGNCPEFFRVTGENEEPQANHDGIDLWVIEFMEGKSKRIIWMGHRYEATRFQWAVGRRGLVSWEKLGLSLWIAVLNGGTGSERTTRDVAFPVLGGGTGDWGGGG